MSVKSGKQSLPPDPPKPECPPCKAMAPAWMATFADMSTLLMAFFVLILSFAHLNVPKYKEVSGSMRLAFGVQAKIPVVEPPTAKNMIAKNFRSATSEATAIRTAEEIMTDQPQPEIELQTDDGILESELNAVAENLRRSLEEFVAEGKVEVRTGARKVQVEMLDRLQEGVMDTTANGMPAVQITRESLTVLATVAEAQTRTELLIEVIEHSTGMEREPSDDTRPGPRPLPQSVLEDRYRQIRANLGDEISQGLAEVELDGDRIIIRLSEQATFDSGRAELRTQFNGLLDKVGRSVRPVDGTIHIEGHTDDVPMGIGSRYRDNWDLSAARAAAVAEYLLDGSFVTPERVSVTGFADSRPLQSNDTPEGRSVNRRVEIIVKAN